MQRGKTALKVILLIAGALIAGGCATPHFWRYSPQSRPVAAEPLSDKSVGVLAFVDARPKANGDYLPLHLVPLMPFGWQNLETPEEFYAHVHTTQWEFRPTVDLTRAMVAELSRARLFRLVNSTRRPRDYDLVLEGRIISTRFVGFKLTYGLSVAAPVLWALGLPSAHITNRLEMVFILKDGQSGATLWSGEYLSEIKGLNGLYYKCPDFYYHELFGDIALRVVDDLETLMRAAGVGERK